MNDREKPVNWLAQYIGITEGSSEHNTILSIFNNCGLCKRYKITTNDAWCAASVSIRYNIFRTITYRKRVPESCKI